MWFNHGVIRLQSVWTRAIYVPHDLIMVILLQPRQAATNNINMEHLKSDYFVPSLSKHSSSDVSKIQFTRIMIIVKLKSSSYPGKRGMSLRSPLKLNFHLKNNRSGWKLMWRQNIDNGGEVSPRSNFYALKSLHERMGSIGGSWLWWLCSGWYSWSSLFLTHHCW